MATQAERRDGTRQSLLEAAETAFTEQGFHGVSLDAIAAAAGYSKGAVYGRFGGKDALFLAVAKQRFERRTAELSAAFSGAGSLEAALAAMLREQSTGQRKNLGWSAAWLEFVVHASREESTLAKLRELDQRLVRDAARELGRRSGVPESDGGYLTTLALLIGSGLMVERLLHPETYTDADVERLARDLARGLKGTEST